jgi:hypothetical protein
MKVKKIGQNKPSPGAKEATMTDIITERDPVYTWVDIKPTRRTPPAVAAAEERHEIAQRVYDDKVEYFIDHPGEWDQPALDALGAEVDTTYDQMMRVKHLVSNGNVHLFPTGSTGQVSIEDRNYERVTSSSWKRIRRLCAGKAILPGVWAYYVPRGE